MFRIVAYCDDKKVGDVYKALTGKVISVEPPQLVINATQEGGKIKAASNGKLVHMFIAHLRQTHAQNITPKQVQDWLVDKGMSKLSVSYVLKNAVQLGALRKGTGNTGNRSYAVAIASALPKKEAK